MGAGLSSLASPPFFYSGTEQPQGSEVGGVGSFEKINIPPGTASLLVLLTSSEASPGPEGTCGHENETEHVSRVFKRVVMTVKAMVLKKGDNHIAEGRDQDGRVHSQA